MRDRSILVPFRAAMAALAIPLVVAATFALSGGSAGAANTPVATAPVVTKQPVGVTLYPGQTGTFSAAATGAPTPNVQWQLSINGGTTWLVVPGLTSPSFTSGLAGVVENGWEVRAVFTNSAGTATSNPAKVTVTLVGTSAPVVVLQPQSQTVPEGKTATFSAAATGTPTPNVQWQLSTDHGATWIDVAVFTSTSFTSATVIMAESGWEVRAVFSNFAGAAVTDVAVGTVT